MEIVTISVGQGDEFYFYMHYPIKASLSFPYSLKITCILLGQVISLKRMVVLSVKFTILISWSPICIPLILLSALMRLASTAAAVLHNNLDSLHHWRTHIGVKGSNRRVFILVLDSILVYSTENVNLQKDFYSVYLTRSIVTQILQSVCTVKLYF